MEKQTLMQLMPDKIYFSTELKAKFKVDNEKKISEWNQQTKKWGKFLPRIDPNKPYFEEGEGEF